MKNILSILENNRFIINVTYVGILFPCVSSYSDESRRVILETKGRSFGKPEPAPGYEDHC